MYSSFPRQALRRHSSLSSIPSKSNKLSNDAFKRSFSRWSMNGLHYYLTRTSIYGQIHSNFQRVLTFLPSNCISSSSRSRSNSRSALCVPFPSFKPQLGASPQNHLQFKRSPLSTNLLSAKTLVSNLGKKTGHRSYHEVIGDDISPSTISGIDHIRNPRFNKGMAFTLEERQALGIHGLLPPRFKSQDDQVQQCKAMLERVPDDLDKYIYLVDLQNRNERLFYRLLVENVETMMPLVYTPTVGLACQKFGLIHKHAKGLFISIHDKGHIYEILRNWPEQDIRAIVVTDGERILGLGDLGACGMGIPVGKLSLYTALAGIKPHQCLPIMLDVGTNTQAFLDDPYYIGLKQKRVQGPEYDDFVDEFMQAVVQRYGQNTLIQFEDFAIHNAYKLLLKYQNKYCTFNDDIQGTASVAYAGLSASLRITQTKMKDNTFLFLGAGGAATGIATLIVRAMVKSGLSKKEAASKIWLSDADGLLCKSRTDIPEQKQIFIKDAPHLKDFHEMVKLIKPNAILGASACAGAFNKDILTTMGQLNKRPVIFALSNPTSKAECTAADAYTHTEGRAVFASGSPFPSFEYNGKMLKPGQGNNSYIFPGVALGVMAAGIRHISDDVFLLAADTLASLVKEKDLDSGGLYPPLSDIHKVSFAIARVVADDAYRNNTASAYPEPESKEELIKKHMYNFTYSSSLPTYYTWPKSSSKP